MGRRAKRPSRETAHRMKIGAIRAPFRTALPVQTSPGKIGLRRCDAQTEWALKVFKPRYGYYPSEIELCAAVDDGTIGRWIEAAYKVVVEDKVIVLNGREIPYDQWIKRVKKAPNKTWADKEKKAAHEARMRMWRKTSEGEVIAAAIAGTIKGAGAMEALAQKLFEQKKAQWEEDRIIQGD